MNLNVYKVLDDDALAALASKGLLRRAQKDLERDAPQVHEDVETHIALHFAGEGVTVTLPMAGPQQARCTCPAQTSCRHVLAGALFLRQLAAAPTLPAQSAAPAPVASVTNDESIPADSPINPPPDLSPSRFTFYVSPLLPAFDEATLLKWAGRAIFRQGQEDAAGGFAPEIEEGTDSGVIVFRFQNYNIVTRWVHGSGLEGMICSCKQTGACRHRVAAILTYQRRQTGAPLMAAAEPPARATRTDMLQATERTLLDMATLGIDRMSRNMEGRLQTLAVSAHGADLPRLERTLRALADQVSWQINRDVRADAAQLLRDAAHAYALVMALQWSSPPAPYLVGEFRSRYYDVGALEVVGVGAGQWHSRSGYAGLTIYFWDGQSGQWATWGDARPAFYGSTRYKPIQQYRYGSTWAGAGAPSAASRSHMRLMNARRNLDNRLSSHPGCQAYIFGAPSERMDVLSQPKIGQVCFDDWRALGQFLSTRRHSGMTEHKRSDGLVIVTPAGWGEGAYDQMKQRLLRPLYDAAGRTIMLDVAHDEAWSFAVDTLANWAPVAWGTYAILGFAESNEAGINLTPVTLFNHTPLSAYTLPTGGAYHALHVTLDSLRMLALPPILLDEAAPLPSASVDGEEVGDADIEPEDAHEAVASTALAQAIASAASTLVYIAEAGAGAVRPAHEQDVRQAGRRLSQLGFSSGASVLDALADAAAATWHTTAMDASRVAQCLLRAQYVLELAREQVVAMAARTS